MKNLQPPSNTGLLAFLLATLLLLGYQCPKPEFHLPAAKAPKVEIQGAEQIEGTYYVTRQTYTKPAEGSRQALVTIEFQTFTGLRLESDGQKVSRYLDQQETASRHFLKHADHSDDPPIQKEVLTFFEESQGKIFDLRYVELGTGSAATPFTIGWPDPPTTDLSFSKQDICEGEHIVVSWEIQGVVSSVTVDGDTVSGPAISPKGSLTSGPFDEERRVVLKAKGPGGSHTHSKPVRFRDCPGKIILEVVPARENGIGDPLNFIVDITGVWVGSGNPPGTRELEKRIEGPCDSLTRACTVEIEGVARGDWDFTAETPLHASAMMQDSDCTLEDVAVGREKQVSFAFEWDLDVDGRLNLVCYR